MYAERAYLPGPGRERECDSERCRVTSALQSKRLAANQGGELFRRWAVDHSATAVPAATCPAESVTGSHVRRVADVGQESQGDVLRVAAPSMSLSH